MVLPATKTRSAGCSLRSRRSCRERELSRSISRPSYFTEPVTLTRVSGTPRLDEAVGVLVALDGDEVELVEGALASRRLMLAITRNSCSG